MAFPEYIPSLLLSATSAENEPSFYTKTSNEEANRASSSTSLPPTASAVAPLGSETLSFPLFLGRADFQFAHGTYVAPSFSLHPRSYLGVKAASQGADVHVQVFEQSRRPTEALKVFKKEKANSEFQPLQSHGPHRRSWWVLSREIRPRSHSDVPRQ